MRVCVVYFMAPTKASWPHKYSESLQDTYLRNGHYGQHSSYGHRQDKQQYCGYSLILWSINYNGIDTTRCWTIPRTAYLTRARWKTYRALPKHTTGKYFGTPTTTVQKPNNHTKEGTIILNRVKEASPQIKFRV
jgi:hypothetical protein